MESSAPNRDIKALGTSGVTLALNTLPATCRECFFVSMAVRVPKNTGAGSVASFMRRCRKLREKMAENWCKRTVATCNAT